VAKTRTPKKATKPKAPAKARKKAAKPAGPGVTVRMYCQGLGDCFLLSFPAKGRDRPVRVLIDCGVLQHTPGEAAKMRQVVEHLRADTGGEIDLLVVTHEHWDHVAGFSHARDVFERFKFGRVWLSWAENADDPDARAVKADLRKKKKAVTAALRASTARLRARGDDPYARSIQRDMGTVNHLLGFLGLADGPVSAGLAAAPKKGAKPPAAGGMSLGETMDWLRGQVRPGDWCSPGERRPLPGADGVNVYVLGPPRSAAKIRKMDPTEDQGYKLRADGLSLSGAVEWVTGDGKGTPASPFADVYRVRSADARTDPFFREVYGFPDDPLGDAGQPWRRIDDEWLGGVSRLALQLDTGVNNTSLALAFELPDGRALIFPGDAQIGNWLSWDEVAFKTPDGEPVPVTARQLLNRAVFYKVGHHGSHNATRKVGGLEEMTGGDLVAMIPTDESFALKQSPPHGWKMPFGKLYDALKARTHFRILRADRGEYDVAAPPGESGVAPGVWKAFRGRVAFADEVLKRDPAEKGAVDQPLYVEYTIPL
jgi:hypothetical protein